MTRVLPSQQTKIVLSKIFGRENVRVTNGRGTAYGWVETRINIKKTWNCDCPEVLYTYDQRCPNCKAHHLEANTKVEDAVKNIPFYTYADDMGDERREFLLDIDLI